MVPHVQGDNILGEIHQDPVLNKVLGDLLQGTQSYPGFHVINGSLYYNNCRVLPIHSTLIVPLLHEYHNSAIEGHSGEFKTFRRIFTDWYWEGMRKQITQFVCDHLVCQQQKGSHLQLAGLLYPLPIPSQVWEDISMDFVEALPKSGGFDTILVVVDRLTKYAHFVCMSHPFTAPSVAADFVKHIVRLHGFPASIVFDCDKIFMSLFWRELFRLQGTMLKSSTDYHPQTDGQTEVVNRTMEAYSRCFIQGKPRQWVQWLHWPSFAIILPLILPSTRPHSKLFMGVLLLLYCVMVSNLHQWILWIICCCCVMLFWIN